MKENCVNVALPKGRLAEDTIELFLKQGITNEGVVDFNSRRLTFYDEKNNIKFMMVRNMDVSTYVEHGAADIGVVGKDILLESGSDVYEYLDLGFGFCRLCVAGIRNSDLSYRHDMVVATKYPMLTKNFFASKGVFVETIKLYGSIELSPIVGLSDFIVDLVSTGQTLKKNGLIEVETILESTARLIGNKSMAKVKYDRIKEIIETVESV
ncbi:ATP phosphoribosyltransferase [Denitrovibrio acetiphilus DSM 12809]|uniref:ATP phosphoribosyltransferase n=1 Tax=Denitrovibrio acetiphilus (strain DSM 12809 / NBRC 114555 / N2460) TaxID=522772 RepID=D4H336_DENA2|nr:ATP phosphoribosyltransferase [Denitrovibrio acetiphilus]ADD69059.1 ATP phosphoribosyltransferase [Denitrovibrio acetiphilus DSM 12809]